MAEVCAAEITPSLRRWQPESGLSLLIRAAEGTWPRMRRRSEADPR
jgi:hypothetical protein